MTKVLKIEKDFTNKLVLVTCPNCDDVTSVSIDELTNPYKVCYECYYVFPYTLTIAHSSPSKSDEKKFNFDKEKLNKYRTTRENELMDFHTYADDSLA